MGRLYILIGFMLFGTIKLAAQDANITAVEYYIDTDPGIGSGVSVPITSGTPLNVNMNIPTGALSVGTHILVIRAQDENGDWSIQESRPFYVSASSFSAQANIVQMEYYFDTDPGYGNGISIPITSATNLDLIESIPSGSLSLGFHIMHIRALDSDGNWGLPDSKVFFVDEDRQITAVEYYLDTDPGEGNATQIPITPSQSSIDQNINISTSGLSNGNHTVGMRVQNINGDWSNTTTSTFNICDVATANFTVSTECLGAATVFTDLSTNVLTGDVYMWDFDGDTSTDDTTGGNTSFTYLAAGTYNATLTIDRAGCTSTITIPVNVEVLPTANAGVDQNVCTTAVTLEATAAGSGEAGSWSIITGTGTLSNASHEGSTLNSISSYRNELEWTVTNIAGGCVARDTVVIISNQPITSTAGTLNADLGQTSNADVPSLITANPGDILSTTIVQAPLKGIANVSADGSVDYTPNDMTVGFDTLTYQVCNQCGNCAANDLIIDIVNNAPVISPDPISVEEGGQVTLDLLAIISDPNNNLDPNSLRVAQQPISGATASIDIQYRLLVDYSGVFFSGTDEIGIEVCDLELACTTNIVFIDVDIQGDPPISVFNAISPNGDEKHDYLEIQNIDAYPNNVVFIYNRWGDKVFEESGYDNNQKSFNGKSNTGGGNLPGGIYFYSIDLGNGSDKYSGFLVLKK